MIVSYVSFYDEVKIHAPHHRVLYVDEVNSFQNSVDLFSFRNQGQKHRKSESILSFRFHFCRHIQIYHVNYVPVSVECRTHSIQMNRPKCEMMKKNANFLFILNRFSAHESRLS